MSESNGTPAPGQPFGDPTPFQLICEWLPYLSDKERGQLRAMLISPQLVRREGITPKTTEDREP